MKFIPNPKIQRLLEIRFDQQSAELCAYMDYTHECYVTAMYSQLDFLRLNEERVELLLSMSASERKTVQDFHLLMMGY